MASEPVYEDGQEEGLPVISLGGITYQIYDVHGLWMRWSGDHWGI